MTGQNAGWGLQPWSLISGGANTGFFTGSSNLNGLGGGPGINIGGRAWGMFAHGGQNALARRNFNSGLFGANWFSVQMDHGVVDIGSSVGIVMQTDGVNQMTLEYRGGDQFYRVIDATGTHDLVGLTPTDGGLQIDLQPGNLVPLSVRRLSDNFQVWYYGTVANGNFTSVQFQAINTGQGANHHLFFNRMEVTFLPEPASLVVLGAGLFVALRRRPRAR